MNRTSTLKRSGALKRKTPMKQSGFKRKAAQIIERAEREPPPLTKPERFKVGQAIIDAGPPVKKTAYVRSKKLREAFRLIPCQNCGCEDGTVCCAHANWGVYGKGERIKASDDRGASLCCTCHRALDQGSKMSGEERRDMWEAAHRKSVLLLQALGHWPKRIPLPTVQDASPVSYERALS